MEDMVKFLVDSKGGETCGQQADTTFLLEVRETLSRVISVKADTQEKAMELVKGMYENAEIILDSGDYKGVEYIPS